MRSDRHIYVGGLLQGEFTKTASMEKGSVCPLGETDYGGTRN